MTDVVFEILDSHFDDIKNRIRLSESDILRNTVTKIIKILAENETIGKTEEELLAIVNDGMKASEKIIILKSKKKGGNSTTSTRKTCTFKKCRSKAVEGSELCTKHNSEAATTAIITSETSETPKDNSVKNVATVKISSAKSSIVSQHSPTSEEVRQVVDEKLDLTEKRESSPSHSPSPHRQTTRNIISTKKK